MKQSEKQTGLLPLSPFSQVDIIWAMLIVWKERGKIIRSVLYRIR